MTTTCKHVWRRLHDGGEAYGGYKIMWCNRCGTVREDQPLGSIDPATGKLTTKHTYRRPRGQRKKP